jgi:NTP pyrophosphatase (non-canonical NTP hydrolase)
MIFTLNTIISNRSVRRELGRAAADLLASVISSAVSVCVSSENGARKKWESIVVKNAKIAGTV